MTAVTLPLDSSIHWDFIDINIRMNWKEINKYILVKIIVNRSRPINA